MTTLAHRFASGVEGVPFTVPSANPESYQAVLRDGVGCLDQSPVTLQGLLFPQAKPAPLVLVVPGSVGVAKSHRAHAETLHGAGYATAVLDPFGGRSVASTVANQTQYTFAASAFDVCRASALLAQRPEVRGGQVGVQGHSRGGSAVLQAAVSRFREAAGGAALTGVYAVYPWCGHQFLNPEVGTTAVRGIIGDADEWCSAQQMQGYLNAMRLTGGTVSWRVVSGAHHSFDREEPVALEPAAAVAPAAPTAYLTDEGVFLSPTGLSSDPTLSERDLMVAAMKAGYGRKGANLGARGEEEPALFRGDMLAFWQRVLPLDP
jgi:dienelactone hydrolase